MATERGFPTYDRNFPGLSWARDKTHEFKVYVLVDPRDWTVRYVGLTVNPTERRQQHRRADSRGSRLLVAWKRELKRAKLKPLMAVVDSAPAGREDLLEGRWIGYYRRLGRLHNVMDSGGRETIREPTEQELDDALRRIRRGKARADRSHRGEIERFLRTR